MATTRRLLVQSRQDPVIAQGIAEIKREQDLPLAFPPDVETTAARAAAAPRLPELDRTDIALVTIDPVGSMDLDQAMFVERIPTGFRVYYAIADVAAFVAPGDAVDLEANKRGETLYGADSKVPLHPRVLSEGAASLLPGEIRPALLWTIDLDAAGETTAIDVRRARVRSCARLDYVNLQAQIDAGHAGPMWAVLAHIGQLRKQREQARGGISLSLPEQEISIAEDGQWTLAFRARLPLEDWNEQISLLVGMAAAKLMIDGRVGVLRTLPKPEEASIERLRRTAAALGIAWPQSQPYPDFIRSLDPAEPRSIAMMTACTTVLRGAGYAAFEGTLPVQPMHWPLAAEYAHATAPIRRLVDRYVGETCVALCAGQSVPDWVLAALPGLPATMSAADRRASRFERAVLDLAESVTMAAHVGETFDASIVEVQSNDPRKGVVMLRGRAIEAPVSGTTSLPLGACVKVQLVDADPAKRSTQFAWTG